MNLNQAENMAASLDRLVASRNRAVEAADYSEAVKEFALGMNIETRDIDLCIGFAQIEAPKTSSEMLKFGKGAIRLDGALQPVAQNSETSLSLSDLMDSYASDVASAYAFGSVWVDNSASLHCTSVGSGTSPYLMHKDIPIEEMIRNVELGRLPDSETPTLGPGDVATEIYRFVLDVKYYDASGISASDVEVHLIDLRKQRGFGGFAEEIMAAYLTPATILYDKNIDYRRRVFDDSVKKIIQAWIYLPGWNPPGFIAFWQDASRELPANLSAYLQNELGLTI